MQVQEYWNEFESMYVICSMNPYVLAMKQLVQNGLFLSVKDTGLPDPAWQGELQYFAKPLLGQINYMIGTMTVHVIPVYVEYVEQQ